MMRSSAGLIRLLFLLAAIGAVAAHADEPARSVRTIYLIRHGDYSLEKGGDEDTGDGLTPLGFAQARLVAARLRGLPVTFTSLTSSTMTRARQTAGVIHELFPDLVLQMTPALREGLPHTWRTDATKGEPEANLFATEARLDAAFARYFVPVRGPAATEIIVCHGNVIRYFVMKALGVDPKAWLGLAVMHCSMTVIQVSPQGAFKVLSVGDYGHIPPNLVSGASPNAPELGPRPAD